MYVKTLGRFENINYVSESSLESFYVNPQQQFRFLKTGGDVRVGQIWEYVLFHITFFLLVLKIYLTFQSWDEFNIKFRKNH